MLGKRDFYLNKKISNCCNQNEKISFRQTIANKNVWSFKKHALWKMLLQASNLHGCININIGIKIRQKSCMITNLLNIFCGRRHCYQLSKKCKQEHHQSIYHKV
jgi:hypothetical protein